MAKFLLSFHFLSGSVAARVRTVDLHGVLLKVYIAHTAQMRGHQRITEIP